MNTINLLTVNPSRTFESFQHRLFDVGCILEMEFFQFANDGKVQTILLKVVLDQLGKKSKQSRLVVVLIVDEDTDLWKSWPG